MTVRTLRWMTAAVFLACVPGIIVSSIQERTAGALAFGLVAGAAALVLLAVTEVTTGRIPRDDAPRRPGPGESAAAGGDEAAAAEVEARVRSLVAAGADEDQVRDVVRAAVALGRRRGDPGAAARSGRWPGEPTGAARPGR